jgi:hypothetical protein
VSGGEAHNGGGGRSLAVAEETNGQKPVAWLRLGTSIFGVSNIVVAMATSVTLSAVACRRRSALVLQRIIPTSHLYPHGIENEGEYRMFPKYLFYNIKIRPGWA